MPHSLRVKRVYEEPSTGDGCRVLVERLWPRGLTKADARLDLWLKEVAPSPALRRWFGHDRLKWEEFRRRYRDELATQTGAVEQIRERRRAGPVTLVYAARDEAHNSAIVLKEFVEQTRRRNRRPGRRR